MELNFKVYGLYEESKPDDIRYIGRTKNTIEKRLYFHIKGICYDKGHKSNWIKSVIEKGGIIKSTLLLDKLNEEESKQKEIELIALYKNSGYNLTNGTNGGDGLSMPTQETIEKIRKTKTGVSSIKKGKPLSFYVGEERAAIMNIQNSQRQIGKKLTEEHKEKIKNNSAKIWLGKKLPKEMVDKARATFKITASTEEFKIKRSTLSSKMIVQMDKNNNFIKDWPNMKMAAEFIKTSPSGISACCVGKIKSAAGFNWRFKNTNNN